MAKQSKRHSAIESAVNVAIGSLVALLVQYVWFPANGCHLTHHQHIATMLVFAGVNFARFYVLRRVFDWVTHGKN